MDAQTLQLIIPIAGIAARPVRPLPRPRRAQPRPGPAGDAGRRRHDLRGRRRVHPAAVPDDRGPGPVRRVILGAIIATVETKDFAETEYFGLDLGLRTAFAFLVGATCSMASGIIGMYISVKSNVRTAAGFARGASSRRSRSRCAVAPCRGFLVVALSLLGVYGIFALYGGLDHPAIAPFLIVGFGFGAVVRRPVRPARRRDLHEGRRRRVGSRRQGRGGHPRGRPTQRRRHR